MLIAHPWTAVPPLPGGCSLSFSTAYTFHAPTGTPSGKRQYLFHGLNGSAGAWASEPLASFVAAFRANGDEVVLLNLPTAQACFWTNGGWQYREQFAIQVHAVMNAVEAAHGAADTNIVGGISFGGLHSLMAAVITGRFDAFWAHLAVIRIDNLKTGGVPDYAVGNVERFNPQNEVERLSQLPGWIGWGTSDTRVNGALAGALADALAPATHKETYTGLGHTTTTGHAADVSGWTAGL